MEKKKCIICGEEKENVWSTDSGNVCSNCLVYRLDLDVDSAGRFIKCELCKSIVVSKKDHFYKEISVCKRRGRNITISSEKVVLCQSCYEKKTAECRHCKRRFFIDRDLFAVAGEDCYICLRCFDIHKYFICMICNGVYSKRHMQDIDNRVQNVCKECFSENYKKCSQCGRYYVEEYMYYVSNRYQTEERIFCNDCFSRLCFTCEHCNHNYMIENRILTVRGAPICACCYEEDYFTCEGCNNVYRREEVAGDHQSGSILCVNCYDDRVQEIHEYSYFPRVGVIFHQTNSEKEKENLLYLGVELEIDDGDREDVIGELLYYADDEKFFYMKHDGSLSVDGIELCFQPRSLQSWFECREKIEMLFSYLTASGYRSHNSWCGLHIHVNRNFFSTASKRRNRAYVYRLMYIFERHWKDLVKFSRRSDEAISSYCGRYLYDSESEIKNNTHYETVKKLLSASKGKYFAVNDLHRDTVEFRLWRGSLNVETFYATLELTSNICEVAKNLKTSEISSLEFLDLLLLHSEYEDLKSYCRRRDIFFREKNYNKKRNKKNNNNKQGEKK